MASLEQGMGFQLLGKLANTSLSASNVFLPLFEAIVNSIHAIEDRPGLPGKIEITIEREEQQLILTGQPVTPIDSIAITDNGIGFTDENYRSFRFADSTLKKSRGGKGLGRFVWLKAFESVEIRSIFIDSDSSFKERVFLFQADDVGVHPVSVKPAREQTATTTIRLCRLKEPYRARSRQGADVLARRVLEHCMIYFLRPNCPRIILRDGEQPNELNVLYRETIASRSKRTSFVVKGHEFELMNLQRPGEPRHHTIHYCANQREVERENLGALVPELDGRFSPEDGGPPYWLAMYVSGPFLDAAVNAERTDFRYDKPDTCLPEDLTREDLRSEIACKVRKLYSDSIESNSRNKLAAITHYIETEAPEFRILLKRIDQLRAIPSGLQKDKLSLELYKLKHRVRAEINEKGVSLLELKPEDIKDKARYEADYGRYIRDLNEIGQSDLAQYIVHRRVVLELFDQHLKRSDGRYSQEKAVHALIVPLKVDSNEMEYEQQNLWIIDERLTYHKYLASDKPFNQIDESSSESMDRPDLIVFNRPLAFSEEPAPVASVVIVEFKQPARGAYKEEDNPFRQSVRYAKRIREGKERDAGGRPLTPPPHIPVYIYLICDLTPKVVEMAKWMQLVRSPDGLGYFGFHRDEGESYYIEVISFTKLLSDANKRNRVLFEKLNLPMR